MLKKILFKYQNKSQLIIALLIAFVGFVFMLTTLHYFVQINQKRKGEEMVSQNAFVIQKTASNFSGLNLAQSYFSEKEIEHLTDLDFIEEVQSVRNNTFDVTIQTDSELLPYFRSDIFLQSIPSEYMVSLKDNWDWSPTDEFVPLVLPREFLVMINTFASAKGIPQVSENLAQAVPFQLKLYKGNEKEYVSARIIGFTNEISSLLVPEGFIQYANKKYGDVSKEKTSQLLIKIKDNKFSEFNEYLNKRQFEISESSLTIGQLKSFINGGLTILFFISSLLIFTTLVTLYQGIQLIISKNQYEIQTLLRLGYSPKRIKKAVLRYFSIGLFFIAGLSYLTSQGISYLLNAVFVKHGIEIASSVNVRGAILLLIVLFLFLFLSSRKIEKDQQDKLFS